MKNEKNERERKFYFLVFSEVGSSRSDLISSFPFLFDENVRKIR